MFGCYYFGQPYFGQAGGVQIAPLLLEYFDVKVFMRLAKNASVEMRQAKSTTTYVRQTANERLEV